MGTAGLIYLVAGEPDKAVHTEPSQPEVSNVLIMDTVAIRQIDGENLRWEVWARNAAYYGKSAATELEEVRFNFYNADAGAGETPYFHGTADRAILRNKSRRLVFQGQVMFFQGEQLEMRTEVLEYDLAKRQIIAPQRVWVKTPDGIHQGASMRYSIADERLTFTQPLFTQ